MLIAAVVSVSSCNKSGLDSTISNQVDELFKEWDTDSSPGAAIAIVKDGEVIYSKGYGLANLEYGVPNTPNTVFHIASESKQFITYSIVLLAQQGKLSLDDDIRKYLPYVPDFGEEITIKHLIHHTSGLRDQWQLLAISGTRLDDVIKQDHILNLVKKQERLNFSPGERHLYCNTGYTLLGEIIKEVSSKSPREFANSVLFIPLEMHDTHFHDNYKEVVTNRAYSYTKKDSVTFENSILSYSTVGATSLFTTVLDESKWLLNYEEPKVGNKETVEQMLERGVLNSGYSLPYAFAVSINDYKGFERIGHGGGDAGFRTYACRFPEEDLGIVVFSNLGSFDATGMAMKIADIFLPLEEETEEEATAPERNVLDETQITDFTASTGHYINRYEGYTFELYKEKDKLMFKGFDSTEELKPVSKQKFGIFGGEVILDIKDSSSIQVTQGSYSLFFNKYTPVKKSLSELEKYTGDYFSKETNTFYTVNLKDSALVLNHLKYGDTNLTSIKDERYSCSHWWMSKIDFLRNDKDEITGFEINTGRIQHLLFEKQ